MKPNNLTIIIIVSVLVIIAGVIVYFTVFNKTAPKPKPKPKTDCFENDTNYIIGAAHSLGNFRGATLGGCQAACQANVSCNFWTHKVATGGEISYCWLKTAMGEKEKEIGLTSGPKNC